MKAKSLTTLRHDPTLTSTPGLCRCPSRGATRITVRKHKPLTRTIENRDGSVRYVEFDLKGEALNPLETRLMAYYCMRAAAEQTGLLVSSPVITHGGDAAAARKEGTEVRKDARAAAESARMHTDGDAPALYIHLTYGEIARALKKPDGNRRRCLIEAANKKLSKIWVEDKLTRKRQLESGEVVDERITTVGNLIGYTKRELCDARRTTRISIVINPAFVAALMGLAQHTRLDFEVMTDLADHEMLIYIYLSSRVWVGRGATQVHRDELINFVFEPLEVVDRRTLHWRRTCIAKAMSALAEKLDLDCWDAPRSEEEVSKSWHIFLDADGEFYWISRGHNPNEKFEDIDGDSAPVGSGEPCA